MRSIGDKYQRIAPFYDLLDLPFETRRYRQLRPLLFQGLSGTLLDAGVGTGRNIPFYPPDSAVTGIDLSSAMLERAERRRRLSLVSIDLRQMDVTCLAFPDASFDAAVATFLFCVLPNERQVAALREMCRVVKPGGTIRLLEYVRPNGGIRRVMTYVWQPWVAWAYGAGFDRRTEQHALGAGLHVVSSRFLVADLIKLIEIQS